MHQLGIRVRVDNGVYYVSPKDLKKKLSAKKRKEIDSFLGPVTVSVNGLYPRDVEYALSSLAKGLKHPEFHMWD